MCVSLCVCMCVCMCVHGEDPVQHIIPAVCSHHHSHFLCELCPVSSVTPAEMNGIC